MDVNRGMIKTQCDKRKIAITILMITALVPEASGIDGSVQSSNTTIQ